ncbi:MAG: LytTR family DNA-binding domain-containing protein [Clostridia bacterium]
MIQVAICDDVAADRAMVHTMLSACEATFEITEYANSEPLVWDVETGRRSFALYFLDIFLDKLNGVEAARRIRALDDDALIVFITSSEDFYKASYDVFAFYYLVKPIKQAVFQKVLSKALKQLKENTQQVLHFTYCNTTYALAYSEIDYITSENRLLVYHLHNGETRQCYGKLDELCASLPANVFIRCHQSFFVNSNRISALVPKGFYVGEQLIPISRTYAETARNAYRHHLFGVFEQE